MSLKYLHFNIFGLALSDLATEPGSIGERLSSVFTNYLYKLEWEKDIEFIPEDCKEDFLSLKEIVIQDVQLLASKKNQQLQREFPGYLYSPEELGKTFSHKRVISMLHWRKARRAAVLISNLHFGLARALRNR